MRETPGRAKPKLKISPTVYKERWFDTTMNEWNQWLLQQRSNPESGITGFTPDPEGFFKHVMAGVVLNALLEQEFGKDAVKTYQVKNERKQCKRQIEKWLKLRNLSFTHDGLK